MRRISEYTRRPIAIIEFPHRAGIPRLETASQIAIVLEAQGHLQ